MGFFVFLDAMGEGDVVLEFGNFATQEDGIDLAIGF